MRATLAGIYEAARKLVEAQRQRGIEPRLGLRVSVPLRDRHALALTLAELTGANLRTARTIVGDRQLVLEAAPPSLAMSAAVLIERRGGQVEFTLGRIERLACVPDHPARGLQPVERLLILGGDLLLVRGPLAGQSRAQGEITPLIERGSSHQLFAGFEREQARWAAQGLVEVADEAELLARVGAREPRLEARLLAAKRAELAEVGEIYGDWLQAHGDPRGLLATASLALARASDAPSRERAHATLATIVREHASHLLGSVADELRPTALGWLGPGLVVAKLRASTVEDHAAPVRTLATSGDVQVSGEDVAELEQLAYLRALELLRRLLALPVAASLRELELADAFVLHGEVPETLAAAACAAGLETLRLIGPLDLELGRAELPRLRRLELLGVRGQLRVAVRAPALRRLKLELGEGGVDLDTSLAELDAPRLDQLELRLARVGASAGSSVPALEAVLARPSFARLRRLTLAGRGPQRFEGIERALARVPAAARFEQIDLRGTDVDEQTLTQLRARLPKAIVLGPDSVGGHVDHSGATFSRKRS